ncbi:MAG: choline-sulfatase [Caldilineaceae bacterium]
MNAPNILIIQADQAAAQWLPIYQHPVVKMPHLAALADQGVVFDNAYCNSPLCAPSRFSMMSGLLPSQIGAYDNAAEFPSAIPCFTHALRVLGYRTILSGKMHFVGPDQLHGFEERLTTDVYPADYTWTPDWQHAERMLEWYHTMHSVITAGPCVASMDIDYDDDVAFQAERKLRSLVRDGDERPFCLVVSFTHPHDPYIMTPEYWDRYRDDEIDLPSIPALPVEQLDAHSQRLWQMCASDEYEIGEQQIRDARHGYYASLSYIDDKIGQLIATLKATGQYENTIIIFTADHGDMLGERGLWYKMSMFDGSARIPFLVHAPGRFVARRVSSVVSLVDLLPTLVALADPEGTLPSFSRGSSLLPLLQGDDSQAKDVAYVEYLAEGIAAPHLMIRQGRYKYIFTPDDPELLYDLAQDPQEVQNLAPDPRYGTVLEDFRRQLHAHWDIADLQRRIIASQQRRHLISRALALGKNKAWDHQPFEDATQQYVRNHKEFWELLRLSRYPAVEAPKPVKEVTRYRSMAYVGNQ